MRSELAKAALNFIKRDVRVNYSEMGIYNAILQELQNEAVPPKPLKVPDAMREAQGKTGPAQGEDVLSARARRAEATAARRLADKKLPPRRRPPPKKRNSDRLSKSTS